MLHQNSVDHLFFDTFFFLTSLQFGTSVRSSSPLYPCFHRGSSRVRSETTMFLDTNSLQDRAFKERRKLNIIVSPGKIGESKSIVVSLGHRGLNDPMNSSTVEASREKLNRISCIDNLDFIVICEKVPEESMYLLTRAFSMCLTQRQRPSGPSICSAAIG